MFFGISIMEVNGDKLILMHAMSRNLLFHARRCSFSDDITKVLGGLLKNLRVVK